MNIMEALGAGPNLSPKGETPGLNLGADAETMAFFASIFAMMKAPQHDATTAGPVPKAHPQSEETEPLPSAAAMLMAEMDKGSLKRMTSATSPCQYKLLFRSLDKLEARTTPVVCKPMITGSLLG